MLGQYNYLLDPILVFHPFLYGFYDIDYVDLKIFLSYCHNDKSIVDRFENNRHIKSKRSLGIDFVRDTRDTKYQNSLMEFMEQVRTTGFVVMFISHSYLTSFYCMHEAIEFLKDENYKNRMICVVLDDARGIYRRGGEIEYVRYWAMEQEKLEREARTIRLDELGGISQNIKQIHSIRTNTADFIRIIRDRYNKKIEELEDEEYASFWDYVLKGQDDELSELFRIMAIQSREEKLASLDRFGRAHGGSIHFLIIYANALIEAGHLKWAKSLFEEAIKEYPEECLAHVAYADVLSKNKEWIENATHEAKWHYEAALRIDPNYSKAHLGLANLLVELEDMDSARYHLEETLRLDPSNSKAHYKLAKLLEEAGDNTGAKYHYKKALRTELNGPDIQYDYATLIGNLRENAETQRNLEETLRIDPNNSGAHYNLALLLYALGDKNGAKYHYMETLRIDPTNFKAHYNLAILYFEDFDDLGLAKVHYLRGVELNPGMAKHPALAELRKAMRSNNQMSKRKESPHKCA